ncbi:hypothetical protein V6N12_027678 [Hibiscus sabdariffa]|uniref:Uncharacterized protein n=1 Tax=Hibiscus sabdariffa TaxID=183260 RepID=A0ABR2F3L0_9ROSI
MDIKEWVSLNLTEPARVVINPKDWDLSFGLVCWNLWLERNAKVFGNPLEDHGTVLDRSRRMLNQYVLAFNAASKLSQQSRLGDEVLSTVPGFILSILSYVKPKIEVSGEVQTEVEWGETKTSTTVVEVVHKVVVPPMTKVTVNLVATKGTCDVPFTYMQRDTLYDGSIVTSEIEGGTYTGSNYYNIDFVTRG